MGGVEVEFNALTATLDGDEWSAQRSGRVPPKEIVVGTNFQIIVSS
jgi:hypothetical protein